MTGRARNRLTDAMTPRMLRRLGGDRVTAAALAVWFFADGRPIFGVAWLVLAIGWAFVAFGASRVWVSGPDERPIRVRSKHG